MTDAMDKIIKNSLNELKYGLMATIAVLSLSVIIYMFIPNIRVYFSSKDSAVTHERFYKVTPAGGEIIYSLPQVLPDTIKESEALMEIKRDLDTLSRRFMRGKFDFLSIPGSKEAEQVKNMSAHRNNFTYTVIQDQKSARLVIATTNPAAKKTLEVYLNYMKDRWKQ